MAKTIRRERDEGNAVVTKRQRRREWRQDRQSWRAYAREVLAER